MHRKIIVTADGSHSVEIPAMQVSYHSKYGAIQESQHVFIQAGLRESVRSQWQDPLQILEMGFGTGLNALLTLIESEKIDKRISYTAIEPFPLTETEFLQLNYCMLLRKPALQSLFEELHSCEWVKDIQIIREFTFHKIMTDLINFSTNQLFNLIYYDAFAPGAQPELWTKDIFEKLFNMMDFNGILVTYCSKGDVRRAMLEAGFSVEKIPGPRGKREMMRARKESRVKSGY
jgi:tRNA U34 5-methylaminomethyl-2-thiouridine-forming methyltransferase MnmC